MGTIKFVTESGSVYEIDSENKLVRRLTGVIDPQPRQGKDGMWKSYADTNGVEVGTSVLFIWPRATTPLLPGSPNNAVPSTVTSPVKEILDVE